MKYCTTQEANAIFIRWAIYGFNWKRALSNLNVVEQVTVFNRTIPKIMKNFILYETIACDDKDRHGSIKELSP